MKIKMNMALAAGALALSVVGQANATIVTGATGSSDLILTIWDSVANTSYTKDLGINLSSFLSGVTGTATALTATGPAVGNQAFAADALLTSYLSTANTADLVWNVSAVDSTGALAFQGKQMITTTNVNIQSPSNSLSYVTFNAQLGTAISNFDLYLKAANSISGTATSIAASPGDAWVARPNLINTQLAFNGTAAVGSTMNFWYLTPSSTSPIAKASVAQFQSNTLTAATWTLASNGNLTYSADCLDCGYTPTPPIPEPGEWILMLCGLGLAGYIATRRKNNLSDLTMAA